MLWNKNKKIIMLDTPAFNEIQQKIRATRPKQKLAKPDRLRNQLTQSNFYTWYDRKKTKIDDRDLDYNLDNANNNFTDNDFDTKNNKQTDLDEYKRLTEDFFKDLKINPTSDDDLKIKYNKLMAAKQENWF